MDMSDVFCFEQQEEGGRMARGHDTLEVELVNDDEPEFFAPVSSDLIDGLVGQYQQARTRISEVAAFINGPIHTGVVHYFLNGNATEQRGRLSMSSSCAQMFEEKGAIAALNAAYWAKTMGLTDVYDAMPQKRRDEWNASIRDMTTPDYEEETVRATISGLLAMRAQFLGERVDGIFRGLSGEHVTNAPEGFGKRMIISRVLGSFGYAEHSTCGLINDLRCVIAKFMGRDAPKYDASSRLIDTLKQRWGKWVVVDGGALKIRLYMKGTAHMEVHPDMAWRLNQVLASLHPLAIPAEFRQKPKKRAKDFVMMARPLPFRVLEILSGAKQAKRMIKSGFRDLYENIPNTITMHPSENKAAYAEAVRVLESIGGAKVSAYNFEFDYPPFEVLRDIVDSGCIPDQKAHQFYPTPDELAKRAVEMAAIQEGDKCLEPSAGQAGIAQYMPPETTCVEIAPLNVTVLRARGLVNVVQADFMEWKQTAPRVDVIVMNPPFSDNRAKDHAKAAAELLSPGGRLVAILPASHRNKMELPGLDLEWSEVISNAFDGTSVSVVILKATRNT